MITITFNKKGEIMIAVLLGKISVEVAAEKLHMTPEQVRAELNYVTHGGFNK